MKKRKFLKIFSVFLLTFILCFSLTAFIPVSAAEITIVFDGWSKYQNAIRYTLDSGIESYYVQTNIVTVNDDITHILQDVKLFEPSHSGTYGYVNSVGISVPTDKLELLHYIPSIYQGKKAFFSVITKINYAFCLAHSYSIGAESGKLYVSQNSSAGITCYNESSTLVEFNDDSHIIIKTIYSVTIPHETFISGFWFKTIPNLKYEDRYVESGDMPLFRLETWISPIVLSDSVTASQMADSVAQGILDGTGGNSYSKPDDSTLNDFEDLEDNMLDSSKDFMNQSNVNFDISSVSAVEGLSSSARGIATFIDSALSRLPFLKPVFTISLGVGGFAFLFGLGSFAIHQTDVNKEKAARREQFKNRSNKKGG